MTLYKKNLAFIREQSPDLHDWIMAEGVLGGRVEYVESLDALQLQEGQRRIFLHSVYDAERELKEMFRDVPINAKRLIVFGLGDGRILSYIQKHFAALEHLVIVEPYGEVLQKFLQRHDFVEAFTPFAKLTLIVNRPAKEACTILEDKLVTEDALENVNTIVGLIAYQTAFPAYFNDLVQATLRAMRVYHVNKDTLNIFRLLWLVNLWRNLRHITADLSQLRSVFQGRPAIIVSAGPSLNKNIHLLEQLQDKALLIAVGSSIKILESKGIKPHFRMAVDGTKENEPLFQDVDTTRCPLLFSEFLYFPILDAYQGPKVHVALRSHPLSAYLFTKAQWECDFVRSGFSVANVALDMLQLMQCSPIILIGQDMCFTGGKLHAAGSWDDDLTENKWVSKSIEMTDIDGEKVYTDRAFLSIKRLFENLMATYGDSVLAINATEGGLEIEGMLHMPLAEVKEKYLQQSYDFEADIQAALAGEESYVEEKRERMAKAVRDMEEAVAELIKVNEKNHRDLLKTLRLLLDKGGTKQIIKGVNKIAKTFQMLQQNEFYMQAIFPSFANKFKLRHYANAVDDTEWRAILEADLKVFLENTLELGGYLESLQDLIAEYLGKKTLNITVQ